MSRLGPRLWRGG